jgi:hypothetical protein
MYLEPLCGLAKAGRNFFAAGEPSLLLELVVTLLLPTAEPPVTRLEPTTVDEAAVLM